MIGGRWAGSTTADPGAIRTRDPRRPTRDARAEFSFASVLTGRELQSLQSCPASKNIQVLLGSIAIASSANLNDAPLAIDLNRDSLLNALESSPFQ